jgi:hypothetical protein
MNFKITPLKKNAIAVTGKLLKQLAVKVTTSTLKRQLTDHPEYSGLLAISDCLLTWGVENQSYGIDIAKLNEKDLFGRNFGYACHSG